MAMWEVGNNMVGKAVLARGMGVSMTLAGRNIDGEDSISVKKENTWL
jgi:hypothetical protein